MNDHVYKKIDVVGSSKLSIEDAIQNAIKRTSQTVDHVEWFEVGEIRGHVVDGEVGHYQVVMKVGFRLGD
ncbi:MAG: dodecin family protein [Pseudomonadales bacterium]|nr:dodecin family protein [Pseudomonadales bacterium]